MATDAYLGGIGSDEEGSAVMTVGGGGTVSGGETRRGGFG